LLKNASWIEKHFSKIKLRQENKKYYLFGEELENWEEIKDLEKYYKSEAKSYIVTRCNELAQEF
jgi:hypothetical protein